ncbi:MAG: hypothetical protein M1814_006934 [Vezdaea aestivalis]|nr:MAG: hypothetical protein M1814_006934 [Vezdaea aestivalis]
MDTPLEKIVSPEPESKKTDAKSTPKEEAQEGSLKDYFRVFSFNDKPGWILNILAFTTAVGSGVILPLMTIVFGSFIAKFNAFAQGTSSPAAFRKDANRFTLWFIYLFVAKFLLTYISNVCLSISAMRITRAIREAFLEKTLRQEIAFFDRQTNGSVAAQVTTNGNRINQGIADKLGVAISAISTFISAFIIALVIQWKLALITVTIIPAIFIVTGISVGIELKYEAESTKLYAQASALAQEVFSSIKTVQAFWAYDKVSSKLDSYLDASHRRGTRGRSLNLGLLFSNEMFFVYAGIAVAFWQGFRMYLSGEIKDAGQVFTIVLSVVIAATAVTQIAPQLTSFTNAATSASELFAVMDKPSLIDPLLDDGDVPEVCKGHIEVGNVKFAYPSRPGHLVLKGMKLSIPAGKTTALVGASGCGKSTIVGLLERWYDPTSGSLILDGRNINTLKLSWLRSQIRIVEQEPTLLSGSVFDNVLFGLVESKRTGLSSDQKMDLVREACTAANAHDFITQLPEGYHTTVGERASMLSGGQKQRIAIARSIISNPKVLLLDEATSALDPRAELIVQEALDKVSADRTTLVIAHRLSTIKNADNIAVMNNGQVVEQGTHDELIAAGGAYALLVRAQDLKARQNTGSSDNESMVSTEPPAERLETQMSLNLTKTTSYAPASLDAEKQQAEETTLGYSLMKCIWMFLSEQKDLIPWYILDIIATLAAAATYPGQAILFSRILPIFQSQGQQQLDQINFYALMFFVLALGNMLAYFLLGVASNNISQAATHRYRLELFKNLVKQDMQFFDLPENNSGSITSRLSSLPTQLQELMSFNLTLILLISVNVVASSTLAIAIGWKLGLVVVFGGLPPLILSGLLRIRIENKLEEDTGKRFAAGAGIAGEAVLAIRTVTSLTLERNILARYKEKLDGVVTRSIQTVFWSMFWYSLSQSIEFLVMGLGFWYGSQLVSTGEYTSEQFFIVFIGVLFSGQAAAQFFGYTTSITKATVAANYILWLRQQTPVISESDENRDHKPDDKGGVALQKLEFRYPQRPNTRVLKGVNVSVKPGQFIALVGASGCGKSTIISLLERFYDPTSGSINFGAAPISTLSPKLYRQKLSLVQQEPTLYQGSVRENIALSMDAEDEASDAVIEQACRQANAFDFVSSLPSGLDTLVGSRGLQLSGGQRQRIAIARALARDPQVLLLDEATSALDVQSEKIIQAALEKVARSRTTIAVAHRLSTIKDADCIYVFADGRVIERGSHQDLIGAGGVYYEMCQGQRLDQA